MIPSVKTDVKTKCINLPLLRQISVSSVLRAVSGSSRDGQRPVIYDLIRIHRRFRVRSHRGYSRSVVDGPDLLCMIVARKRRQNDVLTYR